MREGEAPAVPAVWLHAHGDQGLWWLPLVLLWRNCPGQGLGTGTRLAFPQQGAVGSSWNIGSVHSVIARTNQQRSSE